MLPERIITIETYENNQSFISYLLPINCLLCFSNLVRSLKPLSLTTTRDIQELCTVFEFCWNFKTHAIRIKHPFFLFPPHTTLIFSHTTLTFPLFIYFILRTFPFYFPSLVFLVIFFHYCWLDISVHIATCYRLNGSGIESRWEARFSAPVQTSPGAQPASYTKGTGSFPGG